MLYFRPVTYRTKIVSIQIPVNPIHEYTNTKRQIIKIPYIIAPPELRSVRPSEHAKHIHTQTHRTPTGNTYGTTGIRPRPSRNHADSCTPTATVCTCPPHTGTCRSDMAPPTVAAPAAAARYCRRSPLAAAVRHHR